DLARQAAAAIPGAGLRGAAQFEAVQAQLAADRGRADEALAAGVEPKSGGAALAWIELARHNARLDAATLKAVQGWDEATRPYGLVGAALGVQD
ncbi:MAG TPA: hypothetical protein VFA26_22490, partial [Gemmataceae bacterium]|nr:hypothetical protein [Gemmataceae bacterium]